MVTGYGYQGTVDEVVVWTDSDHAGCGETRKSTSGGVVMLGGHLMKAWSKQQAVVARSSGEAEYYALVKGGSEGLGIKGIMKDMGYEVGIEMRTDASAAIGIVNRRGLGKVKHIELNTLWMQNQVYRGVFKIRGDWWSPFWLKRWTVRLGSRACCVKHLA